MEIQDVRKEIDKDLIDQYSKFIENLEPINHPSELVSLAKEYLKKSPYSDSALKAISVFINIFLPVHKVIDGKNPSSMEIQSLFMAESLILDLGDSWYRSVMPIIEPVIANCRVSLTTAMTMKARPEVFNHESDDQVIEHLKLASWDFISWIIYLATQDNTKYISSKEVFTRILKLSIDNLVEV